MEAESSCLRVNFFFSITKSSQPGSGDWGIYLGEGDSRENLNQTPKGDQSGGSLSFTQPLKA